VPVVTEAKCKACGEWSEVEMQRHLFGWLWWVESGNCPKCGEWVRVEECETRQQTAEAGKGGVDR
jgi:hypothetical protein